MKYLVLILLLSGCAAPEIVYKPSPVDIPTLVSCKVPSVKSPQWATVGVTAKNTLFEQVRALIAENEQHKQFEMSLVAANKACD